MQAFVLKRALHVSLVSSQALRQMARSSCVQSAIISSIFPSPLPETETLHESTSSLSPNQLELALGRGGHPELWSWLRHRFDSDCSHKHPLLDMRPVGRRREGGGGERCIRALCRARHVWVSGCTLHWCISVGCHDEPTGLPGYSLHYSSLSSTFPRPTGTGPYKDAALLPVSSPSLRLSTTRLLGHP